MPVTTKLGKLTPQQFFRSNTAVYFLTATHSASAHLCHPVQAGMVQRHVKRWFSAGTMVEPLSTTDVWMIRVSANLPKMVLQEEAEGLIAELSRVMFTNDEEKEAVAIRWLAKFACISSRVEYHSATILEAFIQNGFEELAEESAAPFVRVGDRCWKSNRTELAHRIILMALRSLHDEEPLDQDIIGLAEKYFQQSTM
jgi:hypothetical protein